MYKMEQLNIEEEKCSECHKEWCKRMFEIYLKNIYYLKNIHDNDVNNTSKNNSLHDLLNPSNCTKIIILVIILSCMGVWIHLELGEVIKKIEFC